MELIWSVERILERTKDAPDGIFGDPCPNLESFRCTLLRSLILRKLDGSLRTQLELPR